jgi:putative transposase
MPILDGYQIYHNFIREDQGLNNKTPAEKCGVKILGENKCKILIKNTTRIRDKRIRINDL